MGIREKLEAAEQSQAADLSCWHVFDIETGNADKAAIDAMIAGWKAPGNIKDPTKIEERRIAFEEDAKSKSALTDAAPIICLSFVTGNKDKDRAVFSAMPETSIDDDLIDGFELYQFGSEKAMLSAYGEYVQAEYLSAEGFTLSGHNIIGFDLPKIRNRMIRHCLLIPPVFLPYQEGVRIYDTMKKAADFGCDTAKRARENSGFVSFDLLAQALGMDSHKAVMTGADIPVNHAKAMQLLEAGETEKANALIHEILIYSALDAQKEAKAFQLMTGRYY